MPCCQSDNKVGAERLPDDSVRTILLTGGTMGALQVSGHSVCVCGCVCVCVCVCVCMLV